MKRFWLTITTIMLLFANAVADDHGEIPWLDMQKCEICKSMGAHMDVMEHVTWETHKIDDGMLSASVIPQEQRAIVDAIHKKMHATAGLLATGKEMELCGYCKSFGELKQAGAKEQEIVTDFGMITMLTSDDSELVKKIHDHVERTIKEFAAFEKAAATE